MIKMISAVTTSVIINVTTILIATAVSVVDSSSDSSSTGYIKGKNDAHIYKCTYMQQYIGMDLLNKLLCNLLELPLYIYAAEH